MATLTPYDTGERAEPHLLVMPGNAASLDPGVNPHADQLRENYGRVDFDDDESRTVATVHVSKDPASGAYVVHVIPHDDDVTIKWHGEG